jgi:hypothetical protein
MPINFSELQPLRAPAHEKRLKARRDRERLIRCNKGPKKHSVNRERSHMDRARHRKGVLAAEKNLSLLGAYLTQVRAYWTGERDTHPLPPR